MLDFQCSGGQEIVHGHNHFAPFSRISSITRPDFPVLTHFWAHLRGDAIVGNLLLLDVPPKCATTAFDWWNPYGSGGFLLLLIMFDHQSCANSDDFSKETPGKSHLHWAPDLCIFQLRSSNQSPKHPKTSALQKSSEWNLSQFWKMLDIVWWYLGKCRWLVPIVFQTLQFFTEGCWCFWGQEAWRAGWHSRSCMYVHVYLHLYLYLSVYLSIYLSICPSISIYIYIYVYTYIYIYYIYIYMLAPPQKKKKKIVFGLVFTVFLAYFVARKRPRFWSDFQNLDIWRAEVGDDICRYDVIFCWCLQCFWTFYYDLIRWLQFSNLKTWSRRCGEMQIVKFTLAFTMVLVFLVIYEILEFQVVLTLWALHIDEVLIISVDTMLDFVVICNILQYVWSHILGKVDGWYSNIHRMGYSESLQPDS